MAVLHEGYSHDPLIMHHLRSLFFVKAYFDLNLRAVHISSKDNVVADAISHDDLVNLVSQVLTILSSLTPMSPRVAEILVEGQPDWTSVDWVRLFTNCFLED